MNSYIIGGGPAGLIAAIYSGYSIIDKNPLGQLGLRFIPGIRIFKDEVEVNAFINLLCRNKVVNDFIIQKTPIKVGYEYSDALQYYATPEFKEQYSLITRGHKNIEDTFLSSGMNKYNAWTTENMDPSAFYLMIFKSIYEYLKSEERIIEAKVQTIDPDKRIIKYNDEEFFYDKLISTIRADQLEELMIDHLPFTYEHDYTLLKKCFYKCKYVNSTDTRNKSKFFSYVYSICNKYTRKTYFNDYIVYETIYPISEDQQAIDGNLILDKYQNVPIQLQKSLNLTSFRGIRLLGRFAQWNHSIKANEVIKICQKWIF